MATLDDLPLRDDLRGSNPYGAPEISVPVALNLNENPNQIPQQVAREVVEGLAEALGRSNRYPDRDFPELRQAFSNYLGNGLNAEQLWAANGSNEVLFQVLLAFGGPGRTALGFGPSYSMYPILARTAFTNWREEPRGSDFSLDPVAVASAISAHKPDVVFLCSPNNPTGTPLSLETIEVAYEAATGIVVVDEAYAEFAPAQFESALQLLPGRERLLVCRTMSKAFAFAGVRVGYLAADPAVVAALKLVRLPYHLSVLTQVAAITALKHVDQMLESVQLVVAQRERILSTLPSLGFLVSESWANFVLFGGLEDPKSTFGALLEQGILIRDVGIANHLRVTAGTEAEVDLFLDSISKLRQQ
ncbi:MAG: histidinol-phosphate transaminase [Cryobacterium sp.]|nr:histidinol-phosphate transaminase [Cryobacterium sp.]